MLTATSYHTRDLRSRLEYGVVLVPLNGAEPAQIISITAEDQPEDSQGLPLRWWPSEVAPGYVEAFLVSHHAHGGHPDTTITITTAPLRLTQKVGLKVAPARRLMARFPKAWAVLCGRSPR